MRIWQSLVAACGIFPAVSCRSPDVGDSATAEGLASPTADQVAQRIIDQIAIGKTAFSDSARPVCAIHLVEFREMTLKIERLSADLRMTHPRHDYLQYRYLGCAPEVLPRQGSAYMSREEVYKCTYTEKKQIPAPAMEKHSDRNRCASVIPERIECVREDDERWKLYFSDNAQDEFTGTRPDGRGGETTFGWFPEGTPPA